MLTGFYKAQTYTLADLEDHFLKHNYSLIAKKLNINRADAEILQEKLWPNPTLSVGEVNLWANPPVEEMPPLFGNYGRTQQITVELEQLIITARKRKKRIDLKNLEKNNSLYEYEELILNLKKELRESFYEIQNTNEQLSVIASQLQLFQNLEQQYARQSQLKNVSRVDYLRIQTEVKSLRNEMVSLQLEQQENLSDLEILTQIPALSIENLQFRKAELNKSILLPNDIVSTFENANPSFLNQKNSLMMADKSYELAKAERVPDVTLQVNYDRGGNIMQDFIGLGFSVDLPIFNNNKGNIKAAKYVADQESVQISAVKWELESKIKKNIQQLVDLEKALNLYSDEEVAEQNTMIDNYQKQFQNKQVTLLEMIDFLESVRNSKNSQADLQEKYNKTFEEIQYLIGKDL